jgi:antitoxin ParD1/3/4
MKTMSISLPDPLEAFIQNRMESGGYSSASEVVREALRLLQHFESEKLPLLRLAVKQGMDSLDRGDALSLAEVDAHIAARRDKEDAARLAATKDGRSNVAPAV